MFIALLLFVLLLVTFFIPVQNISSSPRDLDESLRPENEFENMFAEAPSWKKSKSVHFSERRQERIFDKKTRKILRDRRGKTFTKNATAKE